MWVVGVWLAFLFFFFRRCPIIPLWVWLSCNAVEDDGLFHAPEFLARFLADRGHFENPEENRRRRDGAEEEKIEDEEEEEAAVV